MAVLMLVMGVCSSPLWMRAIDGAVARLASPAPVAGIAVNQMMPVPSLLPHPA